MATVSILNTFNSEASTQATNFYLDRSNIKFGHLGDAYYCFGKSFTVSSRSKVSVRITGSHMGGNGEYSKTLFWKILKFHSYSNGSVDGMKFIHLVSSTSTNQSTRTIHSNTADTVASGSVAVASGTADLDKTISPDVVLEPNTKYLLFVYDYGGSTTENTRVFQNCATTFTATDDGLVHIGEGGSTFGNYLAYIGNGSTFDLYIPYVGNGSSWEILT